MDRTNAKDYAPQGRTDFIQAMIDRAAFFGLTATKVEAIVSKGDVVVIAGREHNRAVGRKRKALEERIKSDGFDQTMEAMAYTWFNRLVAIRFMEVHNYFEHGFRVLSHPAGKTTPEILEHATDENLDLPGLKRDVIIDMKQAGNRDAELYRLLLTAQCNALHQAMPFLFERIDDETELLLPDNLLNTDSLVRKLVEAIPDEDWQEVEIIGWLYQFYISEKKDKIIRKVVASDNIPAATQLFTPNWIVKYLVQNTLGRQWLATYPTSSMREKMEFYIAPAEQTREVNAKLEEITPNTLDPEKLRLLDPACGSAHILVEAYDLLKLIYQERGYQRNKIPRLILEKNLFGLEIDDRAAQLAAFALTMKARADDRRIFDSGVRPNVIAFVESKGLDPKAISAALNAPTGVETNPKMVLFDEIEEVEVPLLTRKNLAGANRISQNDVSSLLTLFERAKTFGSLIQVPQTLVDKLDGIEREVDEAIKHGDLLRETARDLKPLLQQARLLAQRYDAVVANPPYMGRKYYCECLREFIDKNYTIAKGDLYAAFIARNVEFVKEFGLVGMITIPNWMFLSSYEKLRLKLFESITINSLVHNGRGVWGADFGSCSFILERAEDFSAYRATYKRLFAKQGEVLSNEELESAFFTDCDFVRSSSFFDGLPGKPLAYWLSEEMHKSFADGTPLSEIAPAAQGLATAENASFVRCWHEIDITTFATNCSSTEDALTSKARWFPYNKGGNFRKWYGNQIYCVDWENDGYRIRNFKDSNGKTRSAVRNPEFYFREALSWSDVTSATTAFRYFQNGFIYDVTGMSAFAPDKGTLHRVLGFCNSSVATGLTRALNPTVHFQIGNYQSLPYIETENANEFQHVSQLIEQAKDDWDASETSWNFEKFVLLGAESRISIGGAFAAFRHESAEKSRRMKELEEVNNRLFIEAYGLSGELSPEVALEDITLNCNPAFRYRDDDSSVEQRSERHQADTIRELLSYAVGCVMGRYSLDEPGLIYARSGNKDFDATRYTTFPADDDGIIPILLEDWGVADDAANRIVEFIAVVWPKETLDENLKFIAGSLGPTNGEVPRDTIRRYMATGFYKHHLTIYKKRPIYWLFSSGKERAFQCLVYLHRYNESTLARMRTEYVIPLQGRLSARIDRLEDEKAKATSTSNRKKLQKVQDDLRKQQAELVVFEEKLKHHADRRIPLDLDDGVKVNYAKFGDLVAEAKAITGGKDDE